MLIWDEHAYSCYVKYLLLPVSKTHWEKDGFFSVNEQNLEKKNVIFLNKILGKIAGKAVLDDLNSKIFFVSQPWWPTGFLGIYHMIAWNLKWPLKIGIIWSRWPQGFKMLFPALVKDDNALQFWWYYEIRKQHSNVIRLLVLAHLNDIQTFDIW